MFGDIIKTTARTLASVAIAAVIIGPFLAIQIPNVDYTFFSNMVGKAYAVMSHWVPGFPALWTFITGCLGVWLLIKTVQLALITNRIVLNIFK